ncbi:MAG TPA: serine/threonine-protein kinase [Gemmatimonadales bacterium]|nr:serine/threonine-protein kinase [Gemmatimonadales bacterium]
MTPGADRWDEIERLLDQLLDSEPDGQRQLLARFRSDDPQLGAEVERILHAITRSEQFLRDHAADYASPLISDLAAGSGLLPGSLLGTYEIVRELGRGGAARVYLAHDRRHHRQVAIKVPHDEIAAILGAERFLREIRFAAQLQHPNILPLHDSGESDGVLYYVMPYIEGESLRERLKRELQLPLSDALQIAGEVADALSHSHAHGVVHRDIKPENILLSGYPSRDRSATGGWHALVADFGIARAIAAAGGERLTATGVILGTPEYLSPEQASGSQLDGRSDIYSLGCVVYEMLGGEPPFTAATPGGVLARKMVDPIPSLRTIRPGVPIPVERAVYQALARLPADRFSTAQQFAAALRGDSPPAADLPHKPLGAIRRASIEILSWLDSARRKKR